MSGPTVLLWVCRECETLITDGRVLTAQNPFDPKETICGCPKCKAISSLSPVCQHHGCADKASGTSGGLWLCSKHLIQEIKAKR